ncbi:MAG: hypothetical protein KDA24_13520 [Deltaproteobacteria bacterium]|nr:hypothetical protein [Deltaproteobacteria bacterium]
MFARLDVGLLAFAVADNHVHVLASGSRYRIGEALRRFEALVVQSMRLGTTFDRCYLKPVDSKQYLRRCFRYVLSQVEHHGIDADPLLEGTSLHELCGLRRGEDLRFRVAKHLGSPDVSPLMSELAVTPGLLEEWTEPLQSSELGVLRSATQAALEIESLLGRSGTSVRAREAAVIAVSQDAAPKDIAEALGCGARTVQRMRSASSPPVDAIHSIRRRARLQLAVAQRQQGEAEAPLGVTSSAG